MRGVTTHRSTQITFYSSPHPGVELLASDCPFFPSNLRIQEIGVEKINEVFRRRMLNVYRHRLVSTAHCVEVCCWTLACSVSRFKFSAADSLLLEFERKINEILVLDFVGCVMES